MYFYSAPQFNNNGGTMVGEQIGASGSTFNNAKGGKNNFFKKN